MYRFGMIFASLVMVLWSMPVTAQQQTPCTDRSEFLKHLDSNYKEAPVAMGLTANGGLLEVVASANGSWTIIVTTPNGVSCGVASGLSWENTENLALNKPGA